VTLEQKTTHEASLDFLKFFRLFYVRLTTQGIRATLLWMHNVLNRLIIDQPVRHLCQVTPQLYVGAQFRKRGWRELKKWGISAVVNLREEFDDRKLGIELGEYHYIPTPDDHVPTQEELQKGVEFIADVIERGGKVFIHCGSGVGRAPTMAAAYLLSLGSDPETAWETIRKARPFIRPTRVQRDQIMQMANAQSKPVE
jgi:protein-tyrosine phosphatase